MSSFNYQDGYNTITTLIDHATSVRIFHKKMRALLEHIRAEENPLNVLALAAQLEEARNNWLHHRDCYTKERSKFDRYVDCNNVYIIDRIDRLVDDHSCEKR